MSTTNWNPTKMYHFQLMKISTQESNAILIDQSLFNTWAKKEDFRGGGIHIVFRGKGGWGVSHYQKSLKWIVD